jgi:hypothetical protein
VKTGCAHNYFEQEHLKMKQHWGDYFPLILVFMADAAIVAVVLYAALGSPQ